MYYEIFFKRFTQNQGNTESRYIRAIVKNFYKNFEKNF